MNHPIMLLMGLCYGLSMGTLPARAEFIRIAGGSYSQPDTLRYGVYRNSSNQTAQLAGVDVAGLGYIYLFQLTATPTSTLGLNARHGYATAGRIEDRSLDSSGGLLSDLLPTRTPDDYELGPDFLALDFYSASSLPSDIFYFTGGAPVQDSGIYFNLDSSEFDLFPIFVPNGPVSVIPAPVGWVLFAIGLPFIPLLRRREIRNQ